MRPRNIKAAERNTKSGDHGLSFTADVKEPRMKRDRDSQPCKDKIGGVIKRIAPARGAHKRPLNHQLERRHRVFPDCKDHKRREDGREQKRDQRN